MHDKYNILSVDHGFGCIKTVHTKMTTSVSAYDTRPAVSGGRLLSYGKQFYVLGGPRSALRTDKTKDDMYWHLTLGAIAEEIEATGMDRKQEIVLAAGLPLAEFGRQKQSFRDYLNRGLQVYSVDDREYEIRIMDVRLYPQGYAAIIPKIEEIRKEPIVHVIDIGAWTTDTVTLVHGIPERGTDRSIARGVIRCYDSIRTALVRSHNRRFTDAQIEQALRRGTGLPDEYVIKIQALGREWAEETNALLAEEGFDLCSAPAWFVGGGAALYHQYIPNEISSQYLEARLLRDPCANAAGFEQLCLAQLAREGAA